VGQQCDYLMTFSKQMQHVRIRDFTVELLSQWSSGTYCHVVWQIDTCVLDEPSASMFMVEVKLHRGKKWYK
jgi:hypothetical protein